MTDMALLNAQAQGGIQGANEYMTVQAELARRKKLAVDQAMAATQGRGGPQAAVDQAGATAATPFDSAERANMQQSADYTADMSRRTGRWQEYARDVESTRGLVGNIAKGQSDVIDAKTRAQIALLEAQARAAAAKGGGGGGGGGGGKDDKGPKPTEGELRSYLTGRATFGLQTKAAGARDNQAEVKRFANQSRNNFDFNNRRPTINMDRGELDKRIATQSTAPQASMAAAEAMRRAAAGQAAIANPPRATGNYPNRVSPSQMEGPGASGNYPNRTQQFDPGRTRAGAYPGAPVPKPATPKGPKLSGDILDVLSRVPELGRDLLDMRRPKTAADAAALALERMRQVKSTSGLTGYGSSADKGIAGIPQSKDELAKVIKKYKLPESGVGPLWERLDKRLGDGPINYDAFVTALDDITDNESPRLAQMAQDVRNIVLSDRSMMSDAIEKAMAEAQASGRPDPFQVPTVGPTMGAASGAVPGAIPRPEPGPMDPMDPMDPTELARMNAMDLNRGATRLDATRGARKDPLQVSADYEAELEAAAGTPQWRASRAAFEQQVNKGLRRNQSMTDESLRAIYDDPNALFNEMYQVAQTDPELAARGVDEFDVAGAIGSPSDAKVGETFREYQDRQAGEPTDDERWESFNRERTLGDLQTEEDFRNFDDENQIDTNAIGQGANLPRATVVSLLTNPDLGPVFADMANIGLEAEDENQLRADVLTEFRALPQQYQTEAVRKLMLYSAKASR